MTEQRIERTFETGESAEVNISNVEGMIDIQGWGRPEVRISAVKTGDNGDTTVEIGGEGTRVWAKTRAGQGVQKFFGWLKRGGEGATVNYTVHVPHASSISVSNVSGPIHVTGVSREVEVHSINGEITLEDVAGDMSANTVNGSIEGRRIEGALKIETVSGRVDLSDSRLSNLQADSVDGSIRATGQIDNLRAEAVNATIKLTSRLSPEGEYSVRTVNGSFHLAVPDDTACEVVASGVNVNVTCELPNAVEQRGWGRWSGRVNDGGGAEVRFNTVNGTLTLVGEEVPGVSPIETGVEEVSEPAEAPGMTWEKVPPGEPEAGEVAQPAPAIPGAEPRVEEVIIEDVTSQQAPPKISKMDILKAIERGELRVEDALERLRHLN
jgi:DUF4097 and DUF4098 domain-containing protein YvlB